jgi:hypothetical protein
MASVILAFAASRLKLERSCIREPVRARRFVVLT